MTEGWSKAIEGFRNQGKSKKDNYYATLFSLSSALRLEALLDYRNNQLDRYNDSNLSLYIITFKRKNKAVTRVPLARRYFAALALENSQHSKNINSNQIGSSAYKKGDYLTVNEGVGLPSSGEAGGSLTLISSIINKKESNFTFIWDTFNVSRCYRWIK